MIGLVSDRFGDKYVERLGDRLGKRLIEVFGQRLGEMLDKWMRKGLEKYEQVTSGEIFGKF